MSPLLMESLTGLHWPKRKHTLCALLALILVAFALRVYHLGSLEFWMDEAISAFVSGLGWRGAITYLGSQPFEHPPLYFLLTSFWQRLTGSSEFALRYFSLVCGVLFVALLYRLVKELAGVRLALLAALLATLSPFMVANSQEARMYTLLPCLAVLLLMSFLRALEQKERTVWWLAYIVLGLVGIATHYYFALLWIAGMAVLVLEKPRIRREWLWGIGVPGLLLLATAAWLVALPGPRSSLERLIQGEMSFGLAYKLNKVLPVLMLSEIREKTTPLAAYVLAALGWLLVALGVWWSHQAKLLGARGWRLLVALLVVPLLLSLLIPYGVLGRHLGYSLISAFAFAACGLLALRRARWPGLAGGILVVLLLSSYGLVAQYRIIKGDFGQAMATVDALGQPGDELVLTQPYQEYLVDYYNREKWPVLYLPAKGVTLTEELVEKELRAVAETQSRVWLGPIGAFSEDPDGLVERWLTSHAFQAEKAWFPGSSSVALYFLPKQLQPLTAGVGLDWEGRVRLQAVQRSEPEVVPGDAVSLAFTWQAMEPSGLPLLVTLSLVDDQGHVWAERRSEPCGGQCPTAGWKPGSVFEDHHALLIPAGTPPGDYQLELAWYDPADGRELRTEGGVTRVDLGEVKVTQASPEAMAPAWHSASDGLLRADFGGEIALLSNNPSEQRIRLGQSIELDLHWLALQSPEENYSLRWELVGSDGQVHATWTDPQVAGSYPTGQWKAGEYLRVQKRLELPAQLAPGRYRLRLSLLGSDGQPLPVEGSRPHQLLGGMVRWRSAMDGPALDLATLRILDRPREFDVPELAHPLAVQVGDAAELLGYELDAEAAVPGGEIGLALVWRARGPTERPYKVLAHLGDGVSPPVAQDDQAPGDGCCPTQTWVKDEVVVDRHAIALPRDLLPGRYWLMVGLYDEVSGQRLPVQGVEGPGAAEGLVFLEEVEVQAHGASGTAPSPTRLHVANADPRYPVYVPPVALASLMTIISEHQAISVATSQAGGIPSEGFK